MVTIYYSIVSTGTHVYMPIEWVDPRDPLRGEFVRLSYPLNVYKIAHPNHQEIHLPLVRDSKWFVDGQTVYVLFNMFSGQSNIVWINSIKSISAVPYMTGIRVRATIDSLYYKYDYTNQTTKQEYLLINLDFGLDRYFVQKGKWTPLENAIRWSSTGSFASRKIGRWGRIVLDGIVVDGEQR